MPEQQMLTPKGGIIISKENNKKSNSKEVKLFFDIMSPLRGLKWFDFVKLQIKNVGHCQCSQKCNYA